MLPNLRKIQITISELIYKSMNQSIKQKSGAFDIPRTTLFEGDHLAAHRSDGTYDRSPLSKLEAKLDITKDQLSDPKAAIKDAIEGLAEQFANQQVKLAIDELNKTPNQVDAKGSFSINTFFSALEKIAIDFDENNNPYLPSLIMSPALFEEAKQIFIAAENDSAIKKRFDEIIETKRKEWNDRESSRKLVE